MSVRKERRTLRRAIDEQVRRGNRAAIQQQMARDRTRYKQVKRMGRAEQVRNNKFWAALSFAGIITAFPNIFTLANGYRWVQSLAFFLTGKQRRKSLDAGARAETPLIRRTIYRARPDARTSVPHEPSAAEPAEGEVAVTPPPLAPADPTAGAAPGRSPRHARPEPDPTPGQGPRHARPEPESPLGLGL